MVGIKVTLTLDVSTSKGLDGLKAIEQIRDVKLISCPQKDGTFAYVPEEIKIRRIYEQ